MNGHQTVRLDPAGPEMRCPSCKEWWLLDIEYWAVTGKTRQVRAFECRSCARERGRLYQALRRLDPAFNESEAARHRNSYRPAIRKHEPSLLEAYDRMVAERKRRRSERYRPTPKPTPEPVIAARRAAQAEYEEAAQRRAYKRAWMAADRARKKDAA